MTSAVDEGVARDLLVPRPLDLPSDVPLAPDADLSVLDEAKIFAAPADPADLPRWREVLGAWRSDARRRTGYDGSAYERAPAWAATCFVPCLVWLWDERLYDRSTDTFTVEKFLEQAREMYGGVDAVVLWHAYPVIGIDERNQWDWHRDVHGLPDVVERFHRCGVQVFADYNPWDVGTRRAPRSDPDELAALVAETGFDGVFLDTLKHGAPEIVAALARTGRSIALEGESRVPLAAIGEHALSWAQWFGDTEAPGVMRAHWYERRHMLHHVRRWNRDHSAELQSAWVNGCGVLVWDDVFGVWVGWNARDRSTLRAMRNAQHAFADVFREGEWTPLCELHPSAVAARVHAHRYRLGTTTLWALVNRSERAYQGPVLSGTAGDWYDVTGGSLTRHGDATIEVCVPARSIAGIVHVTDGDATVARRLSDTAVRVTGDTTFPTREVVAVMSPAPPSMSVAPPDTVLLPSGTRRIRVVSRRRETGHGDEAPWVEAWKPAPPDLHAVVSRDHDAEIGSVAVDRLEVSQAQYARFLTATGYEPRVAHRHVPGLRADSDAPVTHVDLDDARAYAAWAGGRLPNPDEWQLAQQAGANRRRPLVWNWTDSERTDGITRYCLLKGGSDYAAEGSFWYVDGGPQAPEWELKFVLPGGGLQRSSRIGFRCAYDVKGGT